MNFEESVFDFDLNFLEQPASKVVNANVQHLDCSNIENDDDVNYDDIKVCEVDQPEQTPGKKQASVLLYKKKAAATQLLIGKYQNVCENLEKTKEMLFFANEECKKVCIDYKNASEKCTALEKTIINLKNKYEKLEGEYVLSQNQCEAMVSHANQLQSLVKENELKISSLNLEKQFLEKNCGADTKESSLVKKNYTLLKHIYMLKEIVLGKKKLQKSHRAILRNYKKPKNAAEVCDDDYFSGNETDFSDNSIPSSCFTNSSKQKSIVPQYKTHKNDINMNGDKNDISEFEHDSDGVLVSEDTGRGSSLAFSDSGKFFNSPEYFSNDSPNETEPIKIKTYRKLMDASTSPLRLYDHNDRATSPFTIDDISVKNYNKDHKRKNTHNPIISSPDNFSTDEPLITNYIIINKKPEMVDCATNTDIEARSNYLNDSLMFEDINLSDIDMIVQEEIVEDIPENDITDMKSDVVIIKGKPKLVDRETNTNCDTTFIDRATTPILLDDISDINTTGARNVIQNSSEYIICDMNTKNDVGILKEKPKLVDYGTNTAYDTTSCDRATSPILFDDIALITKKGTCSHDRAISPIIFDETALSIRKETYTHDRATSPIFDNNSKDLVTNINKSTDVTIIEEKLKQVVCGTSGSCETNSRVIIDDVAVPKDCSDMTNNSPSVPSDELIITDGMSATVTAELETIKDSTKFVDSDTHTNTDVPKMYTATNLIVSSTYKLLESDKQQKLCNIIEEDINAKNDNYQNNIPKTYLQQSSTKQIVSSNLVKQSQSELAISSSEALEKKYLENYNSKNVSVDSHNDSEIEMILNSMRLEHRVLTPLPCTPSKSNARRNSSSSPISLLDGHSVNNTSCTESNLLREETKVINEKLANLTKEVLTLTCFLQQQFPLKFLPSNISQNREVPHTDIIQSAPEREISIDDESNINDSENFGSVSLEVDVECRTNVETTNVDCSTLTIEPVKQNVNADELPLSKLKQINCFSNNSESVIVETQKVSGLSSEIENNDLIFEVVNSPNKKSKKLTKLQRFKNKMLPKCKIMSYQKHDGNLVKKKEQAVIKNVSKTDIALRNSKSAYEKAVKIMADIKTKEKRKVEQNILVQDGVMNDETQNMNTVLTTASVCDDIITLKNRNQGSPPKKSKQSPNVNKEKIITNDCKVVLTACNLLKSGTIKNQSSEQERTQTNKIKINMCEDASSEISKSVCTSSEVEKIIKSDFTSQSTSGNSKTSKSKATKNLSTLFDEIQPSLPLRIQNNLVYGNENANSSPPKTSNARTTRSRSKLFDCKELTLSVAPIVCNNVRNEKSDNYINDASTNSVTNINETTTELILSPRKLKGNKRAADEITGPPCKRVLRSSKNKDMFTEPTLETSSCSNYNERLIEYSDLSIFSENNKGLRNSMLCKIIDHHGRIGRCRAYNKPVALAKQICDELEREIAYIVKLSEDKSKQAMNKLVEDMEQYDLKAFLLGFMDYLQNPARRQEMLSKSNTLPAPSMTRAEAVLLYVIRKMADSNYKVVDMVLSNIEYTLFNLKKSPDFDAVESLSHFYALLCRYFRLKSRLRMFLYDAMYCLCFKVVVIVKQCLEVWMNILPLAHMGIAKSPLVTCIVYLLHFFKCEDRLNRIQYIRNILTHKYFYQMTNWNETKILDMFRAAVKEIKDNPEDKKTLRMALIILAKRNGADWSYKNVINKILLPMIENKHTSKTSRNFCISMLGPILKPFSVEKKVECTIVSNKLLDMTKLDLPHETKEAVFTSLIFMSKHHPFKVTKALWSWRPEKMSREFEMLIKDFIREKTTSMWVKHLGAIYSNICPFSGNLDDEAT